MIAFNCRDKNAKFDADELEDVAGQAYILRALDDMKDKDLKAIVETGNTKKAEAMIRTESAKKGFVPENSFQGLAPNAKEYTEGVQDKIGKKGFLDGGTEEQIEVYEQLLAARASVNAVRNSFRARSLDKPVDLEAYNNTLKQLDCDGTVPDALSNLIEKAGAKKVQEWARTGHGGLLEDKVKEEIRDVMSSDEKWNEMTPEEKKFMISEYALLQKQSRGPNGMNSVMGDIAEHNEPQYGNGHGNVRKTPCGGETECAAGRGEDGRRPRKGIRQELRTGRKEARRPGRRRDQLIITLESGCFFQLDMVCL